ncbi:MAG: energy transducer TonB [Cyclobacteriaceae bacterium]
MQKLIFSLLLSVMSFICLGQNNDDKVYSMADEHPSFKYGMAGFYYFVSDNLEYPEESFKNKIEGKVMVQFVVNKDGEVTDEKVVQGLNEELDAEALRIMKLSPNWIPDKLTGGEACNVRMILPITFKAYIPTEEQKAKSMKYREKMMKKYDKKNKTP